MNTYNVTYEGPLQSGYSQTQASNVHTAVKNVLAVRGGRTNRGRLKPVAIRRGQRLTIRVTRIS